MLKSVEEERADKSCMAISRRKNTYSMMSLQNGCAAMEKVEKTKKKDVVEKGAIDLAPDSDDDDGA